MASKLKWKRANQSGQVMSQCGRYWYVELDDEPGQAKLWHDDTNTVVGVFGVRDVRDVAEKDLESLRNYGWARSPYSCKE
jgi:hypothetical protein